ncbi:MAG TPA: formylmethanofuran--tetrahydromethanopterin N-formyltransferase [Symbiobacteriaceae bacterium]|nr:formylmethanofuran--tetrahydromethanopterin N-formyltransferase [Symbiobacteriaceae bacterium]
MYVNGVPVADTFAEAFAMWGARVIVTAAGREWALAAGRKATGQATSIIGCDCEADIERELDPAETPDGRPGVSLLLFASGKEALAKRLVSRVGQSVMTAPTTACFDGLGEGEQVRVGGVLRLFGDGYQSAKQLDGIRYNRIPVLDGEFFIQDRFYVKPAVGGGNLLVLGQSQPAALKAAEAAVTAMKGVPGVGLPFPGGIVRSGSKVGARYKGLVASTNDAYCPTLRARRESLLPPGVNAVYEIVVDGLTLGAVEEAMRRGILAACDAGAAQVTAANFGGKLGQYQIHLRALLAGVEGVVL